MQSTLTVSHRRTFLSVLDNEWGNAAFPVVAGHEGIGRFAAVERFPMSQVNEALEHLRGELAKANHHKLVRRA